MQKGVYLYFIHYAEVFNKVQHKDLFELQGNLFGETCEKNPEHLLGVNCLHVERK